MTQPALAPPFVAKGLAKEPIQILRELEAKAVKDNAPELPAYGCPLLLPVAAGLPPDDRLLLATGAGPWRAVISGVCLGRDRTERELWRRYGPSVEVVLGVDLAANVAGHLGLPLTIWVPDFEYCLEAAEAGEPANSVMGVAGSMADLIGRRHPASTVVRSSAARERVASRVASREMAVLFPGGIEHPFNLQHWTFWNAYAFLATVACLAASAADHGQILVVLDHDQLRSMIAARELVRDAGLLVDAAIYWPAPRLSWDAADVERKGRDKGAVWYMAEAHRGHRRMHSAVSVDEKLFLDDTREAVLARLVDELAAGRAIQTLEYLGGVMPAAAGRDALAAEIRARLARLREGP